MSMPITETVKAIDDMSTTIVSKISSYINIVLQRFYQRKAALKAIEIARKMKIEYPYESEEYVAYMLYTKSR